MAKHHAGERKKKASQDSDVFIMKDVLVKNSKHYPEKSPEKSTAKHSRSHSSDEEIDWSYFTAFISDPKFIIAFLLLFSLIIRIIYVNAGIPHFDSIADVTKGPEVYNSGSFSYSYGYGAPVIVLLITVGYALDHLITGATNAEFAYFFITIVSAALSIAMLYIIVEYVSKNKLVAFFSALFF